MGVIFRKMWKFYRKYPPSPHKPAYIAFVTFLKQIIIDLYLFKNKIWFYRFNVWIKKDCTFVHCAFQNVVTSKYVICHVKEIPQILVYNYILFIESPRHQKHRQTGDSSSHQNEWIELAEKRCCYSGKIIYMGCVNV